MQPVTHRIHRQIWKVRTDSTPGAFQLRRTLSEEWQGLFLSALGQACDEFAGNAGVFRAARLEFRFKARSEDQIPQLFAQAVREQLEGQVRPKSSLLGAEENSELASENPGLRPGDQTGPTPAGEEHSLCQAGARSRSNHGQTATASRHRFEVLLHYLQTGLLPWEIVSSSDSRQAAEFKAMVREQVTALGEFIAGRSLGTAPFFRLLQLLDVEDAGRLVDSLAHSWPASWRAILVERINQLLGETAGPLTPHRRLLLASALLAETQRSNTGQPDFRSTAMEPDALKVLNASLPEGVPQGTASPKLADRSSGEVNSKATKENEFPLSVHYAGLVLLHPFLARFLESADVKEPGGGLSQKDLPRCAALLHWLATGSEEIYEYELGFIKVLLGLRPQHPLCVSEGMVEAADRDEAEGLLRRAIGYWSSLKNTSVAGLRSSFLTRPGLLGKDDCGWKLQVERQAFDVLLDRLPWTIGVVKLPWIAKPIFTSW